MRPKSRITAALLAIFFGTLGIHKLYLGRIGGFIFFMFLFVISVNMDFPITAFMGMVQGLMLFFMSNADFDKKYNRGFITDERNPLNMRRETQLKRNQQLPGQNKYTGSVNGGYSAQSLVKVNALKNSGIKKYKDFDLEEAIADFKSGIELIPKDPALHFNLACAYSLTESKALAFRHISLAVENGMKDTERILTHEDLAFIRIQPEFEAFKQSGYKRAPELKNANPEETVTSNSDQLDDTLLDKLKKLADLRERGVLSDIEFEFERKKVLRQ